MTVSYVAMLFIGIGLMVLIIIGMYSILYIVRALVNGIEEEGDGYCFCSKRDIAVRVFLPFILLFLIVGIIMFSSFLLYDFYLSPSFVDVKKLPLSQ